MITREKFDSIKEKYGRVASWAIWAHEDEEPKSNMGDLTVLDPEINKNTILLWAIPLILFVFGGILIIRKVSIK